MSNQLINNIQNKIEGKIQELNIKPDITPAQFLKKYKLSKHRYSSSGRIRGKEIMFFARLHDNLDAKEKMQNEIKFLAAVNKAGPKIKKFTLKLLDYGIEKDFEWLVRKYPKALPLSNKGTESSEVAKKLPLLIFAILKTPLNFFQK